MYSKVRTAQFSPFTRQVFVKTRVGQPVYQCDDVFTARIHYHTAVGLSLAPSFLSKISSRNEMEGGKVTGVKGIRGHLALQDALSVPWRKTADYPKPQCIVSQHRT